MEMSDIFFVAALEWIYDKIEDRFGRVAAWIGTILLSVACLGAIAAAAWHFVSQ
jgi:hypothetical protein